MEAEERRARLLKILKKNPKPISGSCLAKHLGVSRQVIVQDVALMRAGGEDVIATPQGYILITSLKGSIRRIFAVRHNPEEIEEELRIIIDCGGKVLDVIVEHPFYGELKGLLMIGSPADLKEFMTKFQELDAQPLSALTGGIHLHTVEADDASRLDLIGRELKKKGLLLEEV